MTGCVTGLTPLCLLPCHAQSVICSTEAAPCSLLQVMNSPEVGFIRSHLFLVPAVLQEWFLASRKLVRNLENWIKRYQQLDASELGICLPNQLDDLQRWVCPYALPPAEPGGLLLAQLLLTSVQHVGSNQARDSAAAGSACSASNTAAGACTVLCKGGSTTTPATPCCCPCYHLHHIPHTAAHPTPVFTNSSANARRYYNGTSALLELSQVLLAHLIGLQRDARAVKSAAEHSAAEHEKWKRRWGAALCVAVPATFLGLGWAVMAEGGLAVAAGAGTLNTWG